MRRLTLAEIQAVGLEMLTDVAAFCEANGIDYFLTAGTLLGSVRHKGFVPWDDDIDITMPRQDYERFLATYRPKGRYRLLSCRANRRFWFPFSRVEALDTVMPSGFWQYFETGIYLDVFPLDSFRSARRLRRIMKAAWILKRFVLLRFVPDFRACWKSHRWKSLLFQPLVNAWSVNLCVRVLDWLARTGGRPSDEIVAVVGAPGRRLDEHYRRSDLLPTRREGLFEGRLFRIPNRPEILLGGVYGDYQNPPPPEKRKPNHFSEVYRRS